MKNERREEIPAEALAEFEEFVRFVSRDPAKNRARFYLLTWQPTLDGEMALVCTWGRLGTQGRSLAVVFPERSCAQAKIAHLIRRRFQHGYQMMSWR